MPRPLSVFLTSLLFSHAAAFKWQPTVSLLCVLSFRPVQFAFVGHIDDTEGVRDPLLLVAVVGPITTPASTIHR